jgi:radical SAM-linked protein
VNERTLQRMRVVFAVGESIKYISHLDLLRAWERALRRARVPLAYSQGFNPHPRIVIAMPLPVGCTAESEAIDVYLEEPITAGALLEALAPVMPPGLRAQSAQEVALKGPALPSVILHAVYHIELAGVALRTVRERVETFLQRDACEVTFRRKTFDLLPLVGALDVAEDEDAVVLTAVLVRLASGRIGRPDVLLDALGLAAHARRVRRTQIAYQLPGEA